MDDSENPICDASDKARSLRPATAQTAPATATPLRPEHLLFAASKPTPAKNKSFTRETETNYALSKTRTLTAGVPGEQLSDIVNRAIQRIRAIDADGLLFAGDPNAISGEIPDAPGRQPCLIWIPGLGKQLLESIPHWVHVASSRLSQKLDQETDWFDAIRTIGVQSVGGHALLMTADGVTADPFVCRIGRLFRVPVVRFEPLPNKLERSWVIKQLEETYDSETLRKGTPLRAFFCWLKNADAKNNQAKVNIAKPAHGDADRLLAAAATMSLLLSVRNKGTTLSTSQHRLQIRPGNATRILVNANLTKTKVTDQLLAAGAVGWWLAKPETTGPIKNQFDLKPSSNVQPDVQPEVQPELSNSPSTIATSLGDIKSQPLLIHWTRRRVGAWPDQTQEEYLDDLIFRSGRRRHHELAALCRILASRRIIASNQLTRDRRTVTCLSDMTLKEMMTKRVFRSHLSRWDFEPYGIAFKRNVFLRKFGARPVAYGGEGEWQSMEDDEKPYFQIRSSSSAKIDWQQEKEWRVIGDVDLNLVGSDEAVVFVGRESEIATLSELSIWPVVAIGQIDPQDSSGSPPR